MLTVHVCDTPTRCVSVVNDNKKTKQPGCIDHSEDYSSVSRKRMPSLERCEALKTPALVHRDAMSPLAVRPTLVHFNELHIEDISGVTSPPPKLRRRMATNDCILLNIEADMMVSLNGWRLNMSE